MAHFDSAQCDILLKSNSGFKARVHFYVEIICSCVIVNTPGNDIGIAVDIILEQEVGDQHIEGGATKNLDNIRGFIGYLDMQGVQ